MKWVILFMKKTTNRSFLLPPKKGMILLDYRSLCDVQNLFNKPQIIGQTATCFLPSLFLATTFLPAPIWFCH